MLKLQDILTAIPMLKPGELQRVRTALDAADSFVKKESVIPRVAKTDDWITDGISYELKRRGLFGANSLPWARIYQQGPVGYEGRALAVQQLLLGKSARYLSAAEKLLLGRVAARALADFCEIAYHHVGLRILLQQIDSVPEALDRSFPGYLEAGLVDFLIAGGKV